MTDDLEIKIELIGHSEVTKSGSVSAFYDIYVLNSARKIDYHTIAKKYRRPGYPIVIPIYCPEGGSLAHLKDHLNDILSERNMIQNQKNGVNEGNITFNPDDTDESIIFNSKHTTFNNDTWRRIWITHISSLVPWRSRAYDLIRHSDVSINWVSGYSYKGDPHSVMLHLRFNNLEPGKFQSLDQAIRGIKDLKISKNMYREPYMR